MKHRLQSLGISLKVLFLSLFLIVMVFPLYWITITSLKPSDEIFSIPLQYWPAHITFDNFINIFNISNFHIYIMNSLIVSLTASLVVLMIAVLSAYVLARYHFKGNKQIMYAFFLTQMIPAFIGFAPLYIMMSHFGLLNKLYSLMIVYTAGLIPFCTIMLRGFFQRIPSSLEEAAMIDGCSRLSALLRVILPVMLPGIAATFIFAFVQNWNELFLSIMFIDQESSKTIPVAINGFITKFNIDWGPMSAGAVLSVIPTIIIFAFCQKMIVGGLTQGAEKG
ncbi:carbohydrate ABC transporter permease [Paenibacillus terrigena]|uniref:carbohydrate ABC transporter permease n=1 Tax=Paenibacillus terrigena TaxID=369333 RepID=UPI000367DDFE|nr:carbohydrate ABC transporter permease [Paenibacillus terrigena]